MLAAPTQAPSAVVMVRPHQFTPNPFSTADNAFQSLPDAPADVVAATARAEVDQMAALIAARGVAVHVFDDLTRDTPDSVFPNNWFSTHHLGDLALYPMYHPNRRGERRADIVDALSTQYAVTRIHDYSGLEDEDAFLEGTGAMVLDHVNRLAYVCRSRRADERALAAFCAELDYEAVVFDAVDENGVPIYHTNVLMAVGTDVAVIGLDAIPDPAERDRIGGLLRDTGHEVVDLTHGQIASFAGNALELRGTASDVAGGRFLVMSNRGIASLTDEQRHQIESRVPLLGVDIPTIELAGGSARCMLGGIHLPPRVVHVGEHTADHLVDTVTF